MSDNSGSTEICQPSHLHRGEVDPGRSLRVGVWHVPAPDMELGCYLWCNEVRKKMISPSLLLIFFILVKSVSGRESTHRAERRGKFYIMYSFWT